MFSRSKRFTDQGSDTPAVGQYDVSKGLSTGGAVFFPKDKRFKEPGTTNDGNLLDISNCSTASTRSTGSLNNGVFITPRKPCGKAKSKGLNELRCGELTKDERLAMESDLTALKEEVEKLRKQIEHEMERNKELVYQQNNYECSLKTAQADLELTKSQIAALQQQIISLEQMNVDITENREELESQCSKLHGINITLEKEKLAFQDRFDEMESNWKNTCATKEKLSADLLSCRERHQLEIETFAKKLADERVSFEGTVVSYKNKIDNLKLEMDESLRNQMETIDNLKIEKETILVSLGNLKDEHEQAQQEMLHLQEVITRKEELSIENIRKCQNLEDEIVILQQDQKAEVEALKNDLKMTKVALTKSEEEYKTISEVLQELETKCENVCQTREQLEHNLNVLKQDKRNVDNEIVEAQILISALRENEHGQKTFAETVITKLELCNITITQLNKTNTEYEETIKANYRKVQDVLGSLQTMTKKCETLENQFALSQKSQDAEVERLAKELELSRTSLTNKEREYETMNEAMVEMKRNYDDHRMKLEHDIQVTTKEKNILDRQLSETQKKVEALKENETAQTELMQHNRDEIEKIKDQLLTTQEENRSLAAAQEKANKLKQEFGRRLIEAQKKLSQKDIELQNYNKDLNKLRAEYESQDSWKRKFEDLEEKIAPFQEQLDAYELEKQALLSRNTESQSEIDKLGQQYARLLGHQNQKQKIRHVQKLMDENASLKQEVLKLREEVGKERFSKKRLDEKLSKATGTRRFDPSRAFKHSAYENKENTPLK